MKADVKPARAVWQLDIPSDVPEPIVQRVMTLRADDIASLRYEASRENIDGYYDYALVQYEAAEIAERYLPIATDPRMETVWHELTRKSGGAFYYPARSGDQDAALVDMFMTAVGCRSIWRDKATSTRKQAEQERDRWLVKADELERDAATMGFGPFWELTEAARTYRDHADKVYTAGIAMASKYRQDGRARWVVLRIADTCQRLFDSPRYGPSAMYGTTATIASVVLRRKISKRRVQQWWNGRK
jgi:hypothetical protein